MARLVFHYIAAFFVLTLYGGQVCPYVESLTLIQWGSTTLVLFIATFSINYAVYKKLCGATDTPSSDIVFKTTFTLFMLSGFAVGIYNAIVHGFPLASGFKLIVGWFLIGFFMSLDITLYNRQKIIKYMATTGKNVELTASYISLTKKYLVFSIFTSLAVLGVIFLVIIKDLDWIFSSNPNAMSATLSILKEFAFIFIVIISYSSLVAVSFTRNLKLYLHYQNSTLNEVVNGNLNATVPVSSIDEFGYMAKYTNEMIHSLKERTEALQLTQDVSILSLASLAETRDNETGAHIMRTQRYILALAEELKSYPDFSAELTDENIDLIFKSAPLHDIGKVGIPDNILLKPGKLTDDEFKVMKRHPNYGRKALHTAGKALGKNSFLKFAEEIAFTHHEKWNGSGYPRSLKGSEIPISGRMMAVADVYDALISKRVYKPAFTHEDAKNIIIEGRGNHFDPQIVDAFLKVEQKFINIADEYSDENYRTSKISV
ncbi:MAG: hypothetical protein C0603_06285 [Denitrovibrio sp.]|nr:MAG: hypothetical protein C0603_06285 [Denitrovibrio sp.]